MIDALCVLGRSPRAFEGLSGKSLQPQCPRQGHARDIITVETEIDHAVSLRAGPVPQCGLQFGARTSLVAVEVECEAKQRMRHREARWVPDNFGQRGAALRVI